VRLAGEGMKDPTTVVLQKCLQRWLLHDRNARQELLLFAKRRLRELVAREFSRYPSLRNFEQTDDLLQESMFRLWQSMEEVKPVSVIEFMGLAALQIRRCLCDLARKHHGRSKQILSDDGDGNQVPRPRFVPLNSKIGDPNQESPDILLNWAEFHDAAGMLPEPERTAFDLLFYGDLPQPEVAGLMNVSERQVRRYWQNARRILGKQLFWLWPSDGNVDNQAG
jgi:RNA polymerase sigma factor (sigma-70 family)